MDLKWAGLRACSDAWYDSNACFLRHILQVRYAQRSWFGLRGSGPQAASGHALGFGRVLVFST